MSGQRVRDFGILGHFRVFWNDLGEHGVLGLGLGWG